MTIDICIVGGGFGGLEAAFSLKDLLGEQALITLIDRNRFHSFIPSIHEISSGKITARSIQIPFETLLLPTRISFVQQEVVAINTDQRSVVTGTGSLNYDYLVLAAGAANNFFTIPGAEEHSFRFRSPEQAEQIHTELVRILSEHRRETHLVLVGGGTEGIEVAGEIMDLIKDSGYSDDLAQGRLTITLVEGQPHLLPGFPQDARIFAKTYLQDRGVTIMTGHHVTTVDKDRIFLGPGMALPCSMLIWTGGIKPSRLIEQLALPKDRTGWLLVTDKLQSPADDRVYAVGDTVSIEAPGSSSDLQRLAYHAQDQAVVASLNITYQVQRKELIPYNPRPKPQLVSLGRGMGIYTREGRFRSGPWVVVMKKAIERKHLMAYLSRPLLSSMPFRIPGADLIKRAKLLLPF